jgi:hypothetical protein
VSAKVAAKSADGATEGGAAGGLEGLEASHIAEPAASAAMPTRV